LGTTDDGFMEERKKVDVSAKKVTPEEFLGPNAKLVDFDDLISKPTPASEFLDMHCKYTKLSSVHNQSLHFLNPAPPSNRPYLSCDVCLEDKREDYWKTFLDQMQSWSTLMT